MWMTVGEQRFAITLANNAAARALVALLPLTLDMSDLNRNEKYAALPKHYLPKRASRERSTAAISCCMARTPWSSSIRTSFQPTHTRAWGVWTTPQDWLRRWAGGVCK
ncbi:hypothetical protein PHLH3_27890 [Pseudomonas sp. St386]|nr:hypothetical protein PHLH3_27890 [Pseudomonas sp. St386]